MCPPLNQHFSPYSGMAKGISSAEVTSNSANIKPIPLAIVDLHTIRQAVSGRILSIFEAFFENVLGIYFLVHPCTLDVPTMNHYYDS